MRASARKVAQATSLTCWASEHLAQARGVSPKRDPTYAPAPPFEPSPRRRGARLSSPVSPERDPSAWARDLGETVWWLVGCLLFYDWKCLGMTATVKYMYKCMFLCLTNRYICMTWFISDEKWVLWELGMWNEWVVWN